MLVIDRGSHFAFPKETLAVFWNSKVLAQELQGNATTVLPMARSVDVPHPAAAEQGFDFVRPKGLPGLKSGTPSKWRRAFGSSARDGLGRLAGLVG